MAMMSVRRCVPAVSVVLGWACNGTTVILVDDQTTFDSDPPPIEETDGSHATAETGTVGDSGTQGPTGGTSDTGVPEVVDCNLIPDEPLEVNQMNPGPRGFHDLLFDLYGQVVRQ